MVAFPSAEAVTDCLDRPAQVVDTLAGPVQYAEAGQGRPLLFAHGALGGYDQGLGMTALFALNGFRVIAPSRPGYLGTPLGTGRTYAEQADALAALLDALGIDRVAAIGFSGGGPLTYQLAARHPGRVSCLVEISSPSTTYETGMNPLLMKAMFSRIGIGLSLGLIRFMVKRLPESATRTFLQDEAVLDRHAIAALAHRIMSDPYRAAFVTRVWASRVRNVAARFPGARNDLAQNAALTELPLAAIACPTLIVQSPAREPARHAEHAAATIPGAELRWIPDGCHIGLWVNDDTREQQQAVLSWLQERTAT
jgi:pimeloyl-ACP methyl ester carboxylesterase